VGGPAQLPASFSQVAGWVIKCKLHRVLTVQRLPCDWQASSLQQRQHPLSSVAMTHLDAG